MASHWLVNWLTTYWPDITNENTGLQVHIWTQMTQRCIWQMSSGILPVISWLLRWNRENRWMKCTKLLEFLYWKILIFYNIMANTSGKLPFWSMIKSFFLQMRRHHQDTVDQRRTRQDSIGAVFQFTNYLLKACKKGRRSAICPLDLNWNPS